MTASGGLSSALLMLQARGIQLGIGSEDERESGFEAFVRRRNPGLLRYEHIPRLIDVGERVLAGEINRLMVMMPPRYFKSETFSRLLTAEFLHRFPELWAAIVSHGADLAWELSAEARENYQADGGILLRDTTAKKRWRTMERGGLWAAGTGGPLLGSGYHLGIVDDPIDVEDVRSVKAQKKFERWWGSKFLSRQEPGAAIVVVMQRLGSDDPIDFLFRREVGDETEEAPEHWHVVCCDELKSDGPLGKYDGPQGLPPTCTLEPDPRKVGIVLAPSRFSKPQVEKMQNTAGTEVRDAQRQQRPAAPAGDFWRREWFGVYDELPPFAYDGGKDWDTAFTANEKGSASGYIESYRGPPTNGDDASFRLYIEDVDWDWVEFPELIAWMKKVSGPHYIEAKASGKSAKQTLDRERIAATEVTVKGDKFARATSAQPVASNRRIFVKKSIVRKLLEGESQGLLRVTVENLMADGPGLDVNDMFVQAIQRHTGVGAKKKFAVR